MVAAIAKFVVVLAIAKFVVVLALALFVVRYNTLCAQPYKLICGSALTYYVLEAEPQWLLAFVVGAGCSYRSCTLAIWRFWMDGYETLEF